MTLIIRAGAVFAMIVIALSISIDAQWVRYPTADVPRTRDGKPNLAAPAPRLPNGKPDLSGVWNNDGYGAPGQEGMGPTPETVFFDLTWLANSPPSPLRSFGGTGLERAPPIEPGGNRKLCAAPIRLDAQSEYGRERSYFRFGFDADLILGRLDGGRNRFRFGHCPGSDLQLIPGGSDWTDQSRWRVLHGNLPEETVRKDANLLCRWVQSHRDSP